MPDKTFLATSEKQDQILMKISQSSGFSEQNYSKVQIVMSKYQDHPVAGQYYPLVNVTGEGALICAIQGSVYQSKMRVTVDGIVVYHGYLTVPNRFSGIKLGTPKEYSESAFYLPYVNPSVAIDPNYGLYATLFEPLVFKTSLKVEVMIVYGNKDNFGIAGECRYVLKNEEGEFVCFKF